MPSRLRSSLTALAAAGAVIATAAASNAAVAPSAALAAPVDISVAPAANAAFTFQTLPDARCVLAAPGTHAKMTVYANDAGIVSLHFTPRRGGAANGALTAQCAAHGVSVTKVVRLHVVAGAAAQAAVRPAPGAAPLIPRGTNPAALSDADIKRLALPPRPDAAHDPKAFAQWQRAMTMPVRRIGGSTILRTDVIHGPSKHLARTRPAAKGQKNGYYNSDNWSGIVAAGAAGQFTYWVAGEWYVPSVTTDIVDSPAYSSVWDGIDGSGSGDVIQNGTEQDAYNFPFFGSISSYSAWYEFYPDNGSTTLSNFSVNPGDEIYAVSWLCYDGAGNRYGCYYMQDITQGEASPVTYEQGSQPALFSGNSAEWVTERPTVGGNLNPLPNFGAFPFFWQHVYDSFAGGGRNACDEAFDIFTMTNGSDSLASTYTTGCDSSEFYWLNYQ